MKGLLIPTTRFFASALLRLRMTHSLVSLRGHDEANLQVRRLLRLRLAMTERDTTGATLPCLGTAFQTAPSHNPLPTPRGWLFQCAQIIARSLPTMLTHGDEGLNQAIGFLRSRNMIANPDQDKNRTKFIHSMGDIFHWSVYRRGPIIKQIISSA